MALRKVSSVVASVFLTNSVASTSNSVKTLSLPNTHYIHSASYVNEDQSVGFSFFSINNKEIDTLEPKIVSDEEWANFKALEGLWSDEDIDENWLDNVRAGWDDHLRDLYGPDWD